MTNSIIANLAGQIIADTPLANKMLHATPSVATDLATAPAIEAVTVSANAQTSTKLLNAARTSDGVNASAVAQARASIQNGTYNVTPEDLATSIIAALKGRNS